MFGGGDDVSHTSGCQRMLNSIICAICGFPIVLLGGTVLLGWNEKRDVCEQAAILSGQDAFKPIGCTDALQEAGNLVFFNCNLLQTGLMANNFEGFVPGEFASALSSYVGTGVRVRAEMELCVETSRTEKDSVGGGSTTIYDYKREWRTSWVDSSNFRDTNKAVARCGALNPPWPTQVPRSGSYYAPTVKADAFTLSKPLIVDIPLQTSLQGTAPVGWSWGPSSYAFSTSKYSVGGFVGNMRLQLYGNDWSNPQVSVLGKNTAGTIQTWTAPDSWLCSGYTLLDLRMGTKTIEEVWELMAADATAMTWVLRFVGFVIAWVAFCLLAGPLEVAADCIPCIGPCLGDMISTITCVVSCLPATACCLGVVGVVWVAMRPMVGIPLMLVFVITMTGLIVWKTMYAKKGTKLDENGDPDSGDVIGKSYCGPVDEGVAQGFLNSLRSEYVYGQGGAVGGFFESVPEAAGALEAYEEQIRASGDASAAIRQLAREWGMRPSE